MSDELKDGVKFDNSKNRIKQSTSGGVGKMKELISSIGWLILAVLAVVTLPIAIIFMTVIAFMEWIMNKRAT